MSIIYKLGEGPINYEWNLRYITIKGKELTYSLTINSEEKRTINLEGAITSNICRIKGNKYSFALIIPIFQVLFFSTDSYQETITFRDQIIQAASTSLMALKEKRVISSTNPALIFESQSILQSQHYYPMTIKNNQQLPYSNEFSIKVETLRREVVFVDNKYRSYYIGLIQYSLPKEIPIRSIGSINYWSLYTDLIMYILQLLIPVMVIYFITWYSNYNKVISIIAFLISLYYRIIMKISLFSYSSHMPCSYIVKAKTIINCNKEKVLSLLRNTSLRSEWDFYATQVHLYKENALRMAIDLIPSLNSIWLKLLMRINETILTKRRPDPRLVFDRMEFQDNEGNDYVLFKSIDSKGSSLYNEKAFELFVVKAVKDVYEEKTLVVFVTNNDWRNYDMSYSMRQYMKEQRLNIINSLREYLMSENISKVINSFL